MPASSSSDLKEMSYYLNENNRRY